MTSHNPDRRPAQTVPVQSFPMMARPRCSALSGGAIATRPIAVFSAFASISTVNLVVPLRVTAGFSIALHYLLASFGLRDHPAQQN